MTLGIDGGQQANLRWMIARARLLLCVSTTRDVPRRGGVDRSVEYLSRALDCASWRRHIRWSLKQIGARYRLLFGTPVPVPLSPFVRDAEGCTVQDSCQMGWRDGRLQGACQSVLANIVKLSTNPCGYAILVKRCKIILH
jgi:hypothetical protein